MERRLEPIGTPPVEQIMFPREGGDPDWAPAFAREQGPMCCRWIADWLFSERPSLPQSAKWMSIARAASTACVRFCTPSFRRIAVM